jgi:hypothetical protein
MKRNVIARVAAVALGLTAMACSDDAVRAPTAPSQEVPALAKAAHRKVRVNGVRWRKQLKSDASASALIGAEGGVLVLPATGLRLVVPPGAVPHPTRFDVTALAGKLVAYDFKPAGSAFPVPLRVEQDPAFLGAKHRNAARVVAAYFPSRADLDQTRATGDVAELIPTTRSSRAVTFLVWHFSGYMMSWGLADSDPDGAERPGYVPHGFEQPGY